MAVIYYGEGTHDAGFVGFRVARTVGVADDYRQEYFSLREYSYATAHRLAYSLDRKWEAEAEEVKRQNKGYTDLMVDGHLHPINLIPPSDGNSDNKCDTHG